ncbi:EAL domain-containing protein [Tumidithrix elongata RA019]|uniref:EAL domain-containing protein n=1 Tax=Tumidithrix elongata BACA0141 TaxID=2716417 RepID=A0AAW9PR59_9CYAN|nr:EAL domain-containing protein [Tumidithrix elongata RA019]
MSEERLDNLRPFYQELIKQEQLKKILRIAQETENATIGVFSSSLDGDFWEVSQSFCELLGYTAAELKTQNFAAIAYPDDLATYVLTKDRLLIGDIDICHMTMRCLRKGGQSVNILFSIYPLQSKRGEWYFLYKFEDITDCDRTQKVLKESEERSRLLFESNPNPMWIYNTESLRFLSVNTSAIQHYGYSREEFLAMTIQDICPQQDIPALLKRLKTVPEDTLFSKESRHCKRDGTIIFVEVTSHSLPYNEQPARIVLAHDITEQRLTEAALQQAEAKYRSIFENSVGGIFQSTEDGHYITANPMLASIYGYDSPEDLMNELTDISTQLYVDPQRRIEFVETLRAQDVIWRFESQVRRKDGTKIWISENARAIRDAQGRLLYYEGTVEDITERKLAEAKIAHLAFHDSLTDLPNRSLFRDRLNQAIALAERQWQERNAQNSHVTPDESAPSLSVLFLDLDRFKFVNDTLGHAAGDTLLQAVSQRILKSIRKSDTLARMGGDEFLILLPEIRGAEDAISVAQKILRSLEATFILNQQEVHIGASIGISFYPNDGVDPETLMKNADTAMFRAKEQGRNHYQLYTHVIGMSVFEHAFMENSLRKALHHAEFRLFYQPQVELNSGQIIGMEALVRWQHPELGLLEPGKFIPQAEEYGLIVPLGEWVLRQACSQNKAWQDMGLLPIGMSVNFSVRQFQSPDFVETIAQVLEETGLDPKYLELEITESVVMKDEATAIALLQKLYKMGIQISIDDFGMGYSSFSHLKQFPVRKIKIDISFIRDINISSDDAAITTAIIAMAHSLKLKAIAEGVETMEQLNFLQSLKCDAIQGYLFSKPLPADEVTKMLVEKRALR